LRRDRIKSEVVVKIFPTHRQLRRARLRLTLRAYAVLLLVLALFAAVVAAHYWLPW
jgi:hypothetical protein